MKPRLRPPMIRRLPLAGLALAATMALAQAPATSPAPAGTATPAPAAAIPAAPAAPAASAPPVRVDSARAIERCETSVTATLRQLRGNGAQNVRFVPSERVVLPGEDAELAVRGAGQYRGNARADASRAFTYVCSYNVASGTTSGVALREAAVAEAEPWQPDLSRISPEACDSAVARALTDKHPRVARIAIEPDTRRLRPGNEGQLLLLGQGAVERAPGMSAVPFSYTCEVDPRSGQVVAVRTSP
jgi:hypothetical protein